MMDFSDLHIDQNPYQSTLSQIFQNLAHREATQQELDQYSFSLATNGGDYQKVTQAITASDAVQNVVNPIVQVYQILTGQLPTSTQIDAEVAAFSKQPSGTDLTQMVVRDILSSDNNPFVNINDPGALGSAISDAVTKNWVGRVNSNFGIWASSWGTGMLSGQQSADWVITAVIEHASTSYGQDAWQPLLQAYNAASADGHAAENVSLLVYASKPADPASAPAVQGTIYHFDNSYNGIIFDYYNSFNLTTDVTVIHNFRTGIDKIQFDGIHVTPVNGDSYTPYVNGGTFYQPYFREYTSLGSYNGPSFFNFGSGNSTLVYYNAGGIYDVKGIVLEGMIDFHATTDIINA